MSDGKDAQEPSMEEILSSIRRIIADEEDDGGRQTATAKDARGMSAPDRSGPSMNEPEDDVLELTEIAADEPAQAAASAPPPAVPTVTPFARAERDGEPTTSTTRPAATPRASKKEKSSVAAYEQDEGLLSSTAASASTSAFAKLTKAAAPDEERGPPAGNARTIEQLVSDLMRPLLKEWLEANLPQIVERVVEQEVKKLARRAELL